MFPEVTRDDIFRLETERLWLRWPRAADTEIFVRLAGDPEVARQTATIPYPYEANHAERFILAARSSNADGSGLTLTIAPKKRPNEAIGVIAAQKVGEGRSSLARGYSPDKRLVATLGYWLGRPYWSQGFMGEAAGVFLDLVFGITTIDEIAAAALPENPASLQLLEKLGFVPAGRGGLDAPARGGQVEVEWRRLTRGGARTMFGSRRPKLTSS
ncbi:GNAT family N-acetyltransferase [Methylocystis heyeri]|uniref:GNAT family N-acetyltransferase n=1 Tax=Methylocystis heyeri TaxID=391905 RepID=A0A6B8KD79_9HYPH|nr:GNAT family N-acetyltransferase [Methylocystis heyeri]QGM46374.1 GNAT family N-acetyltransferase [Methylocystis heyeri]